MTHKFKCANRYCETIVPTARTFCCKACSTYRGKPREPKLRLTHCATCDKELHRRQYQYCSYHCMAIGKRSPFVEAVWELRRLDPEINIDAIALKLGITSNQARSALYRTEGRPASVRIRKLGPRKDPW